jgi:hypothetical protein
MILLDLPVRYTAGMSRFRLPLALVLMVPAWSLIGGWQAPQDWPWSGIFVGGVVGVFFGLVFGGGLPSRCANRKP